MHRRDFIRQGMVTMAASTLALNLPACHSGKQPSLLPGTLLSGCDDDKGNHYIASVLPTGQLGFLIRVPLRVHDSCVTPDRSLALFFARRPGHHIYVVDLGTGQIKQIIEAEKNRHFYGHGVINASGEWLFVTENDYENARGIIGIYRVQEGFRREGEWSSHGLGPHQLKWMADGKTLVVANGGILTHPDQDRENLNPDTMQPSLVYLHSDSGTLVNQLLPPHHQMSIRHLDVSPQDQVIVGIQHQGALSDSVPLVGSHSPGDTTLQWWMADELDQLRMHQYTASVAIDRTGRSAVISCPRGNGIAQWNLQTGTLDQMLEVVDAAGLYRDPQRDSWIGTNGRGQVLEISEQPNAAQLNTLKQFDLRWDNHATLI